MISEQESYSLLKDGRTAASSFTILHNSEDAARVRDIIVVALDRANTCAQNLLEAYGIKGMVLTGPLEK